MTLDAPKILCGANFFGKRFFPQIPLPLSTFCCIYSWGKRSEQQQLGGAAVQISLKIGECCVADVISSWMTRYWKEPLIQKNMQLCVWFKSGNLTLGHCAQWFGQLTTSWPQWEQSCTWSHPRIWLDPEISQRPLVEPPTPLVPSYRLRGRSKLKLKQLLLMIML